jgi:transcriptional regulator with XRE-family HTH domain
MAIEWELYRKIRQLYLVEQLSQRSIARLLSVSRKTIRKYCNGAVLPDMRNRPGREARLRKVVEDDILRLLEENKKLPKKERRSGTDIWKYCAGKGYCHWRDYRPPVYPGTPELSSGSVPSFGT